MAFYLKDLKNIDPNDILDEKEKQKCQDAFNAFDKNGSKKIEKNELRLVLEGNFKKIDKIIQNWSEMGQNPTEEELIKMINEVDQTGEGAICKKNKNINTTINLFFRL